MDIIYKFVNGERAKVLVDEKFESVIMQMEKDLYNNNQKETRRHKSLYELIDKAGELVDESINVDELALENIKMDKLYEAISKLKPSEQDLIKKLYLDKPPMTQAEYAKYLNIKETSVCQKAWRTKQKLKKLLLI